MKTFPKCDPFSPSFNKHGIKIKIGNRPVAEAKKMKCYKRQINKQFVQISGLCGPRFLSYLSKHFTHLCKVLCKKKASEICQNQQNYVNFGNQIANFRFKRKSGEIFLLQFIVLMSAKFRKQGN